MWPCRWFLTHTKGSSFCALFDEATDKITLALCWLKEWQFSCPTMSVFAELLVVLFLSSVHSTVLLHLVLLSENLYSAKTPSPLYNPKFPSSFQPLCISKLIVYQNCSNFSVSDVMASGFDTRFFIGQLSHWELCIYLNMCMLGALLLFAGRTHTLV